MKSNKLKKVVTLGIMTIMSLGMLAGCGSKAKEEKSKYDEIQEKKKVVVGLSADYAPYEFHAMIDGKDTIVGFDVELAKEVAKDLGVELEIKEMEFDALLTALPAGQIDLIISGLNPDPKRAKVMDFSEIYYTSSHGILVKSEDVDKYSELNDLFGKKVGVQLNSTQQEIAEEKIQDATLTKLSNVNNLVLELKGGKVDALVIEKPVGEAIVKSNKDLAVGKVEFPEDGGGNAIAVPKGDAKLLEAVNKTVKRLVEDGTMERYIVEATELQSKKVD